jgi:hypothetical protein
VRHRNQRRTGPYPPASCWPAATRRARDDTTVLVSISGFTMLTERLARVGKIQPPV